MILLRAIYFCTLLKAFMQYHWNTYYCKLKALSPQRGPPQSPDSHVWWLKVLSLCSMPAFTVRCSANNDNGKCDKITRDDRHFWSGSHDSYHNCTLKHQTWEYCLFCYFSSLCDHLHQSESQLAMHTVVKVQLESRAGFPDDCIKWKVWRSSVWMLCPFY